MPEEQKRWTRGPPLHAFAFDRATIKAHTIACARVEEQKASKSSIIMIRIPGAPGTGAVQFGQVQQFYEWVPPWEPPNSTFKLSFADVRWFQNKPATEALFKAPVVSRAFWDDPSGNLWRCENIVPTFIGLVPHYRDREAWQVVHTDKDFTTREY